jgi:hypothetical protein
MYKFSLVPPHSSNNNPGGCMFHINGRKKNPLDMQQECVKWYGLFRICLFVQLTVGGDEKISSAYMPVATIIVGNLHRKNIQLVLV